MRLVRVRIENYRCFREPIEVSFDGLTALIGQNDAGKSSILDALDIFFNDSRIDQDDGCVYSNAAPVSITCEFDDLPDEIVIDATHQTSLKEEYLLNAKDRLEITKVYNVSLKKPTLTNTILTARHPSGDTVGDLLQLKNPELKRRARELELDLAGVSQSINASLRTAIRDSCPQLDLQIRELPLKDLAEGREIWNKIKEYLPIYLLFKVDRASTDQDEEAQDPMKEAVKLAIQEQSAELERLASSVRQYVSDIAERTLEKIRQFDETLASNLSPRFEEPRWASVFKISLKDHDDISINKRGSGVRRIVLLGFLQARAEASLDDNQSVIYAIEELETSQHPDKQRALLRAISAIAEESNSQAILTTHTPTLGRLLPVTALRYIEVAKSGSRIVNGGDEQTYSLVAKALGVLPDHDVRLFLYVEGNNDVSYLQNISRVLHDADANVVDLEELEADGVVVFVPVGGSNLAHWISRLEGLSRPELYIVDSDAESLGQVKCAEQVAAINSRENSRALATAKREIENYIHPIAVAACMNVNISFGDFDDVPELVARAIHGESESSKAWEDVDEESQSKKISRAKKRLNSECVLAMTPEMLDDRDRNGEIRGWLDLIAEIISTGEIESK